jgi:hypothetical protein
LNAPLERGGSESRGAQVFEVERGRAEVVRPVVIVVIKNSRDWGVAIVNSRVWGEGVGKRRGRAFRKER